MSDKITVKIDQDEQAITFHSLSDDKELADHEIIDRLFRDMATRAIHTEIGWLRAKYHV